MATLAECLDFVAEIALAEEMRIAEERAAESSRAA